MKYRFRYHDVEAEQWFPRKEIKGVSHKKHKMSDGSEEDDLWAHCIDYNGTSVMIYPGDWIIKQENDDVIITVCQKDDFEKFYEKIKE